MIVPTSVSPLKRQSLRERAVERRTSGGLATLVGALSKSVVAVGAGTDAGFGYKTLVPSSSIRHNKSLERAMVHCGPRLAAARASWPAAQFNR